MLSSMTLEHACHGWCTEGCLIQSFLSVAKLIKALKNYADGISKIY